MSVPEIAVRPPATGSEIIEAWKAKLRMRGWFPFIDTPPHLVAELANDIDTAILDALTKPTRDRKAPRAPLDNA